MKQSVTLFEVMERTECVDNTKPVAWSKVVGRIIKEGLSLTCKRVRRLISFVVDNSIRGFVILSLKS